MAQLAWYWIVLILLAAAIVLICLTRVGALAVLKPEGLTLDVKIGLISLHILPGKEKSKKKQSAKQQAEKAEKPRKSLPKFALEDVKDAARALWPPLKRALNRTRRGIRIKPLDISMTVGAANDPASGAELYGYLHGGVWTVMPVLERLLVIPEPHIHIGIDFDTPKTAVEGTVGISIRIGTLLLVALGVGIPALRWFLRFQKRKKTENTSENAAA